MASTNTSIPSPKTHIPDIELSYAPITITDGTSIRENVTQLIPTWNDHASTSITIEPITSGITNKLFKVSHKDAANNPVIIRVFGGQDVFTADQRSIENCIFAKLSDANLAPRLISVFANGRVEGFKNARSLQLIEMTAPHVMRGVARVMAHLHDFDPGQIIPSREADVWPVLFAWARKVQSMDQQGAFSDVEVDVSAMYRELQRMKKMIEEECDQSPIVFAHNDLLRGNILQACDASKEVSFVDFEYGGFNYRGFDIGNFFCEAMGGTDDGHVRSELFPSRESREMFCRTYLETQMGGDNVAEHQVKALVNEGDIFGQLSHLYWAFWALVQSAASQVDFPYVFFAQQRFAEYMKRV